MLKRIQLPSGAIEYVDTNKNLIQSSGKKIGRLLKRLALKIKQATYGRK